MNKARRPLALFLAVLLLFTIAAFSYIESNHECSGNDCPVCIAFLSRSLGLSALPCLFGAALFRMLQIVALLPDTDGAVIKKNTPVSLKVLLLN